MTSFRPVLERAPLAAVRRRRDGKHVDASLLHGAFADLSRIPLDETIGKPRIAPTAPSFAERTRGDRATRAAP